MAATLTSDDLARAEEASQVLLAPLDYADLDDWRRAATRQLKSVAGAEVSAFFLPAGGGPPLFCEETPDVTDDEYLEAAASAFAEFDVVNRLAQTQVCTETSLLGEERAAYERTPYAQEFLHPMRCFEPAILTVTPDGPLPSVRAMPHLHLHKSRPQERFSEEEVALLRLLYPAFQAGIGTVQQVAARREGVLRTLDALAEGLLLVGPEGRVLHANRALAQMAAQDPEMRDVEEAMMCLARGLSPGGTPLLGVPSEQTIRTSTGRYRLRATLLGEELMGRAPAVLVTARCCVERGPSEEALRRRFRLTRQQARVALLLAERRSNEEIAEALLISPHTARHHVENVLLKLDLHSRRDVRATILGEDEGV